MDGKLDILVANAGISKSVPIEGLTVEDFNQLFAVNVRAPYFLVQQLLPVLGDGSNVIFVSSLGARSAVGSLAAYSATKGAVDTLVKHFAAALGPRGIRVNAVAPGVVDTEMSNFAHTESGRQLTMSMQALKRIATPDDIGVSVSYPLPGTKFYQRVAAELGSKENWSDSGDLAMMFHGAYSSEFYRELADALHAEVRGGQPQWSRVFELGKASTGPVEAPSQLVALCGVKT